MDLFTLVARLGMDTSEYDSKIGKARSSFMQLGNTVSAKAVAFGTLTARMIEKAANAALELGKSTVQAAADVEAEKAQFVATFGEMQGAADKAFKNIEKSTGVFGTRLKNVGTKAFSQFKGAGLDGVDALEMMEKYTNLAADAAAYYDISLEDADARLRSFLRGNTEAGDAIGLFTSESQRNTYAMEEYGKKWLELTEAQKQMLMLNVSEDIYKQSGAIGQAARESSAWTNVIGNLKEVWRQESAAFGSPIMAVITPKIQEFTEWISGEGVQLKIEQFGIGVANKINEFFDWVAQPTFPTWAEIEAGSKETLDGIKEGIKSVLNWTLGKFGKPDIGTITNDVKTWWTGQGDNAYERIKSVLNWTLGKFEKPSLDKVKTWWSETGKPGVTGFLDWTFGELIEPAWSDLETGVKNWWTNDIKPKLIEKFGWTFGEWDPPDIIKIVSDWWNGVKADVMSILTFTITPKINASAAEVTAGYESGGVKGALSAAWDSAWWNPSNWGSKTKIEIQENGATGSFATGLDYVPHNNFYARLHEGERVMTKAENMAYSRGGVQVIDYAAMGAAVGGAVRDALDGIRLYTDDGTAIADLVTERVSRNIESSAYSRRYAT